MPYRLNPNNSREVQKKENGRWIREKLHKTAKQAAAHLAALRINVSAKHK